MVQMAHHDEAAETLRIQTLPRSMDWRGRARIALVLGAETRRLGAARATRRAPAQPDGGRACSCSRHRMARRRCRSPPTRWRGTWAPPNG